ncbi:SMP-30/gluconolactonase/LRE family protein [Spirosoma sp. HMF3257]|uniref:SMP-30/gluconolactonase/LRE family protein n=1 Tax=Spirosoma telluris TaxID=2183553 RepID=A0A327NMU3_9BACT|nr:SMP-30/gluconolactonase/LRE family protein [Spirosoma telluris]RAI75346.1 SMP-30/gluconolactonase/LRE family protein [Spirosoma telluris]
MQVTVQKWVDVPFYTEGPVVSLDGRCFFTTLSGGVIGTVVENGTIEQWGSSVCPNGQVISADGFHWVCDSQQAGIVRFDPQGNFIDYPAKDTIAQIPIHTPNDLILDRYQNLYFTDSIRVDGKVLFRGADGTEKLVVRGIDYPNGLGLSPDERMLYVAESYRNRILAIELREPGVARSKPEVFAQLPSHPSGEPTRNLPDGIAVGPDGSVWVAHYGMQAIQVIDATGHLRFSIDTQLPLTSNLCFIEWSRHQQILLVTGGYGEPGPGP